MTGNGWCALPKKGVRLRGQSEFHSPHRGCAFASDSSLALLLIRSKLAAAPQARRRR
jgi:hypothetical protein